MSDEREPLKAEPRRSAATGIMGGDLFRVVQQIQGATTAQRKAQKRKIKSKSAREARRVNR